MSYYPPGNYLATITSQAMSASKEKGTPCLVLQFTVDKPLGVAQPPMNVYERTMKLYITDGTLPHFLKKLGRLGFYGQSFKQLDPEDEGHHSFIGKTIEVYCKHDEKDDGRSFEEWDISTNSAGNIELAPLPSKALRDLDNRYGKQLKSMFGKNPQPLDAANKQVEESFERDQAEVPDAYAETINTTIAKGRAASAKADYDNTDIPF